MITQKVFNRSFWFFSVGVALAKKKKDYILGLVPKISTQGTGLLY